MKQPKPNAALSALPGDYANPLSEVKQRVRSAQIRAAMAASAVLLAFHWDIGRMILDRQKREGWGAKVIDRLAADLQAEFPGRQGFSPRNLKYMRAFAEAWPGGVFVQPAVAQMGGNPIVQAALAQLPWYHHTILLNKLTTPEDRLWYAAKAVEYGWSKPFRKLSKAPSPASAKSRAAFQPHQRRRKNPPANAPRVNRNSKSPPCALPWKTEHCKLFIYPTKHDRIELLLSHSKSSIVNPFSPSHPTKARSWW